MELQPADGQRACVQQTLMSDGANKRDVIYWTVKELQARARCILGNWNEVSAMLELDGEEIKQRASRFNHLIDFT